MKHLILFVNNFFGHQFASYIQEHKNPFNFYLRYRMINIESVKLTSDLSSNKNLGPYSIPVKVLKNHVDSVKYLLPYFIIVSFEQGILPLVF